MTETSGGLRRGAPLVAAAALLWGLWPLWIRLAAPVSAARVATLALAVAGVGTLPFALAVARPARRSSTAWLLLGALGLADAANVWCYFGALAAGAVAPAVLSHYLAPVLVAVLAPLLLREPRSRRTAPALVLALSGIACLVLLGAHAAGAAGDGDAVARALGLGAASALFYAATVLLAKRLAADFTGTELLAYHCVLAALVLAPLTGVPAEAAAWGWPLVAGAVSALGAGLLYYAGLRRMPAAAAGVLSYLEPVAALAVGWTLLGESPTVASATGGAFIVAAGLLVVTEA